MLLLGFLAQMIPDGYDTDMIYTVYICFFLTFKSLNTRGANMASLPNRHRIECMSVSGVEAGAHTPSRRSSPPSAPAYIITYCKNTEDTHCRRRRIGHIWIYSIQLSHSPRASERTKKIFKRTHDDVTKPLFLLILLLPPASLARGRC